MRSLVVMKKKNEIWSDFEGIGAFWRLNKDEKSNAVRKSEIKLVYFLEDIQFSPII